MNGLFKTEVLQSLKSFAEDQAQRHQVVSRNVNELHEREQSFGDRMGDRLAEGAGSWQILGFFFGFIALWAITNAVVLEGHAFDPYPFILLNLLLSLLAGVQAPVILMSQNRQEAKDRIRAENDYQVNLKAEMEVAQLHQKLDLLRDAQWKELLQSQARQLDLLERILGEQEPNGNGLSETPTTERILLPRRRRQSDSSRTRETGQEGR